MVEIDVARSLLYFIFGRIWSFFWDSSRRFIDWVVSKLAPRSSTGAIANRQFVDLDSIDIEQIWANSIPIILRWMNENITSLSNVFGETEHELRIFARRKKLQFMPPVHSILPLYFEDLIEKVTPTIEMEPSGLVIVKMIVPTFFLGTKPNLKVNWFRLMCKDAMQIFIEGNFVVILEDQQTHELRKYMQQNWLLELEDDCS